MKVFTQTIKGSRVVLKGWSRTTWPSLIRGFKKQLLVFIRL